MRRPRASELGRDGTPDTSGVQTGEDLPCHRQTHSFLHPQAACVARIHGRAHAAVLITVEEGFRKTKRRRKGQFNSSTANKREFTRTEWNLTGVLTTDCIDFTDEKRGIEPGEAEESLPAIINANRQKLMKNALPSQSPAAAELCHPINSFFGNHSSDTSLGLLHISIVTGDQMNMDVRNGLACRQTHVNTYVIPVWPEIRIRPCLCLPNQLKRGISLPLGQVEETCDVPKRNDQQMTSPNRVAVKPSITQAISEDCIGRHRRTEWAWVIHGYVTNASISMNSAMTHRSASSFGVNIITGNLARSGLSGIN